MSTDRSNATWFASKKSMGRTACMARVIVGLNKIGLDIYLCKHVIQGHAFIWEFISLVISYLGFNWIFSY